MSFKNALVAAVLVFATQAHASIVYGSFAGYEWRQGYGPVTGAFSFDAGLLGDANPEPIAGTTGTFFSTRGAYANSIFTVNTSSSVITDLMSSSKVDYVNSSPEQGQGYYIFGYDANNNQNQITLSGVNGVRFIQGPNDSDIGSTSFHNSGPGTVGSAIIYNGNEVLFMNLTSVEVSNRPSSIAAVPEPETYAMMMAGLGILGFMAKRKKPM